MTTTQTGTPGPTQEVADPRRWLALAVIGVSQLMIVLDGSVINIAIPRMQAELLISDADRQWTITAYTLAFGGLLLLGGRVADYLGRKTAFLVGLLGFAAASALGGAADAAWVLFAARALQGAFAALLAPAGLALIAVTFTEARERAKALGVYSALLGGGGSLGLLLGGVLTEYASWRWCLLVNVPIAVAAALAALPVVQGSRAAGSRRYDVTGAVLATAGIVALVYGFAEASAPGGGWTAPLTLALFGAAVVLLVAFVVVESRVADPLLPLRVVLDRARGGTFAATVLVNAAMFGVLLFLTYYLQLTLGYPPLAAGLAFLPFSLGIMLTPAVASRLLPRYGPAPLMLAGLAGAALGALWLLRIDADSGYLAGVLPAQLLVGVGLGLFFTPAAGVALRGVRPDDAGVASAVLNASNQVGGALGTALINTVYVSVLTGALAAGAAAGDGALEGYRVAFGVCAGVFLAALVAVGVLVARSTSDE